MKTIQKLVSSVMAWRILISLILLLILNELVAISLRQQSDNTRPEAIRIEMKCDHEAACLFYLQTINIKP